MSASASVRVRVARFVYRHLPIPEPVKRRMRFALKTRFGALFGRTEAPPYEEWVRRHDTLGDEDVAAILRQIERWPARPRLACFVDATRVTGDALARFVDAMREQLYPDWTLQIVAREAGGPVPGASPAHPRIGALTGGDFATVVNRALPALDADAFACIDAAGVPARHALYLAAAAWRAAPGTILIYGDEDRFTADGHRVDPWFKPDWDPEYLVSAAYIGPWTFFRRDAAIASGGLRTEAGTAQRLDLAMRLTREARDGTIVHLPFIVFHRAHGSPGAATDADRRAVVRTHVRRWDDSVDSVDSLAAGIHLRHRLPDPAPLVSVVIPTRDQPELLRRCVEGLLHRTDYAPLEIVIMDNRSERPATQHCLEELARHRRVRVLRHGAPFNYSAIINAGVRASHGSVLALLNDDIEVMAGDWLHEMVAQALRPPIGAVGARLLYPDGGIQHVGMALGFAGGAGHIHRHARPERDPRGDLSLVRSRRAVTFACVVVRRETFDRAGGLDERLEIAFNDLDFCLKVEELGLRNLITPAATLTHFEAASRGFDDAPERQDVHRRELELMVERWGDGLRADRYYSPNLTLADESAGPAFPPRVTRPWQER